MPSAKFGDTNGGSKREKSHESSDKNYRGQTDDITGMGAAGGNMAKVRRMQRKGKNFVRRNKIRENQERNRSEELALAVSIILANLSCDEDFLKILLGVDEWNKTCKPEKEDKDAGSPSMIQALNVDDE